MSDIKIRVNIDGQEANLTLNEISNKIEDLNQQAAGLDQSSEEFSNLTEQINALKKALDESIKINIDSTEADQKIDDLKDKTSELSQPIDIQVVANTDVAESQIEQLDQTIDQVDSNIEFTSTLDTSEVTSEINDLQTQEPINLEVNTNVDEVKADIDSIESKDVTVQVNSNAGEVSSELDEIASKSIDIPVTGDVTPLEEELNSLNSDIDLTINSNISEIESDINDLDSEINVEITGNIDQIQDQIESVSGQIEVPISGNTSEIEQQIQDITEEVIVPVTGDISDVEQKLDSIEDKEVNVSVTTEVDSTEVDNLNATLDSIEDKEVNVTTNVDSTELSQVSDEINELQDKEVNISTNINTDNLDEFTTEIDKLEDKTIQINTEVNDEKLDEISSKIDDIQDKEVNVTIQSESQELDSLSDDLNSIQDKDISVNVNADSGDLETVSNEVNSIEDKEVNVTVTTDVDTIPVDELNTTLDSIENKEVNVTVVTDDTQLGNLTTEIDSLEGKEVQVTTNVDDSQVQELTTELNGLEDKQVDVEVSVSNDSATEVLSETQEQIQTIKDDSTIQLSVSSNKEEIDALINKMKEGKVSAEELNSIVAKPTVDSSEVDNLNNSINEVNNNVISPEVSPSTEDSLNDLNETIDETKNEIDNLNDTPVNPEVSDEPVEKLNNTSNSVGKLRRELIELTAQLENAEVGSEQYQDLEQKVAGVSLQLAIAKDRVDDLTDGLSTQVGPPVERFTKSFQLLGDGVKNFDVGKINIALKGFGSTIKDSVLGPIGDFGKSLGTIGKSIVSLDFNGLKTGLSGVSTGFKTLGKAVISTGIGALVVGVVQLISNFDELKESGGLVGKVFTAIGDAISFVTEKFRPFLSMLGIMGTEADVKAEKVAEANDKEVEAIELRYNREIELARAAGKETSELEKKKFQALIANAQAEISLLNQIAAAQDGLNKSQQERFDQLFANVSEYAQAINLINTEVNKKAQDDQKKTNDEAKKARDKRLEDEKKYAETIAGLQDKYISDEITKINNKYANELKLIKGNSEQEIALREAIEAKRTVEILKFNEKTLAAEREGALKLEELRIQNEADRLSKLEQTEQGRIEIAKNAEEELYQIRLAALQAEELAALTTVGVTSAQRLLIEEQYTKEYIDLANQRASAIQTISQEETENVNEAASEQLNTILDAREKILNSDDVGIGLFGKLDALKKNLQAEKSLLEKQRDDLVGIQKTILENANSTVEEKIAADEEIIRLNKEFNDKINEQDEEGNEISREIIAEGIEEKLGQVQQLADIANSFIQTGLEAQKSQLETEGINLDNEYARRKALIDQTVTDEKQKNDALSLLDSEFQKKRDNIERKNNELRKKEIKAERNAALVSILLGSAAAIANATKSAKGITAFDYIVQIGTAVAGAVAAISKAKQALKQADAAAAGIGGGGGSIPDTGSSAPSAAPAQAASPVVPVAQAPDGVNPVFQQNNSQNQQTPPPQQFVSVVEIERVRNSVTAVETANTIG